MKKYLLSFFIIVTFAIYTILERLGVTNTLQINQSGKSLSGFPSVQPQKQPSATYKDGEYTGASADAFYGNVQIKATIQGGKITDVQFLDYPQDRRNSIVINTQAMPLLRQEAIQTQNANVDIVSGATATSEAFVQSLQSALSQAI